MPMPDPKVVVVLLIASVVSIAQAMATAQTDPSVAAMAGGFATLLAAILAAAKARH